MSHSFFFAWRTTHREGGFACSHTSPFLHRFCGVPTTAVQRRRGRRCSSSVRMGTGCSGGSIRPSATPRSWSQVWIFSFMIAPFEGSAGRRKFFRLFLQIVALTPTHCMNETTTNYYQIHANTTDRSGDRPAILQEPCLAFALQFDPCVEISAEHTLSPHQPGGRSGKRLR